MQLLELETEFVQDINIKGNALNIHVCSYIARNL